MAFFFGLAPVEFVLLFLSGVLESVAGLITLLKVRRGSQSPFAYAVTGLIFLEGLTNLFAALFTVDYPIACWGLGDTAGYSYTNSKASVLLSGLACTLLISEAIFGAKYLEVGLHFWRPDSDYQTRASLVCVLLVGPITALGLVSNLYIFFLYPTFKPGDVTREQCTDRFDEFMVSLDAFSASRQYAVAWQISNFCFFIQALIVTGITAIGIGLIYSVTSRLATTNLVTINWSQYVLHLGVVLL